MIFSRFNISFLFVTIFLTSCSSMNVTEESVYAGDVKTVQASSIDKQDISYDSQAVFANATVYFDFDKTNLSSKSLQTLKSVTDALNENPHLTIVLEGHADERGTREYNLALGQRRADAVVSYLVGKGVDKNRLVAKGYGQSIPVESNDTDEGRAANRRTEFEIIEN